MTKKIIIIGSGFGGIASALRMRAKGFKVTLVEKHPDLGGRARVFKRGKFIYDGGPTVITAPYRFDELFSLFNKKTSDYVKIVPLNLWYRFVFNDGETFDYTGNDKSMEEQVRKFSTKDFIGYKKLVKFTEKIFDKGFSDLADKPFNNLVFMMKQVPALLKLKSYTSVYSLVSKYISNEKLRRVFSMHPLLVGGNPFSTTSIYTLILFLEKKWGIHYSMGGTGNVVKALEKLMNEENIKISDMMIENFHFNRKDNPKILARKLIRINLSDLAAMGAEPYAYLLNIAIPKVRVTEWLDSFCEGLSIDQKKFNLKLLGGDLSSSKKIFLSMTVLGKVKKKVHLFSSANASSDLYVSGNIGDSAYGFLLNNKKEFEKIRSRLDTKSINYLVNKFYLPKPKLDLGKSILDYADSCTDISDGLITDLKKILFNSKLGANIFINKIPISDPVKKIYKLYQNKTKFWEILLNWGEDYELIFSMSLKKKKIYEKKFSKFKNFTKIGSLKDGKTITLLKKNNKKLILNTNGFSHF